MTTITIPPTTLSPGARTFTGDIADGADRVTVTLDRTPAGGLNSLTAASGVAVSIGQSDDGGATYYDSAGSGWPGGVELDKLGQQRLADHLSTAFEPGTGRKARLTVQVSGPVAVVVAGTIVTS